MESDFFNQPYLNRQFIRFKEDDHFDKTLISSIGGMIAFPLTTVLASSKELFKGQSARINDIPFSLMDKFALPPDRKHKNVVYVINPMKEKGNEYFPIDDFHKRVFESKYNELIRLLSSLGATEILIECQEGYYSETGAHLSVPIEGIQVSGRFDTKALKTSKKSYRFTLPGNTNPSVPDDLLWYKHEHGWEAFAKTRINDGTGDIEVLLEYENNFDLGADLSLPHLKIGGGAKKQAFEKTIWKVNATFKKIYASEKERKASEKREVEEKKIKEETRRIIDKREREERSELKKERSERKRLKNEEKRKKEKEELEQENLIGGVVLISAVFLFVLIAGLFFYKSSNYDSAAEIERERIQNSSKLISGLISEKKFNEASRKINSSLKWGLKESFLFYDFSQEDEDKSTELNFNKEIELLNGLNARISTSCNELMEETNYKSTSEYLSLFNTVYKGFDNPTKSKQQILFNSVNEKVDRARHVYLEQLLNTISVNIEAGNIGNANRSLSKLYHYSENDFKSKYLGIFTTSYKDYWEEKKEALQNGFEKD